MRGPDLYLTSGILAVLLIIAVPGVAQETTCPGGRAPRGDIGVRALRCTGPGASCAINVGDGGRHDLAVEPVVTSVDPSFEGTNGLLAGDVLVAIDGLLITTREGGRRLADPPLNGAASVLVRREGGLVELFIRPRLGCGILSLKVIQ